MRLVKFEKKMCGDCNLVGNFLDEQGVEYEKIDIENYHDLDFISKYVDMAIPVVVLLDDNDSELGKVVKFKPDELEELIAKLKS